MVAWLPTPISSAALAVHTIVADRQTITQTDRPRYIRSWSVTPLNRTHQMLCIPTWPNNNKYYSNASIRPHHRVWHADMLWHVQEYPWHNPVCRPQNTPSRGECGPPSNTWFLEPTQIHNPNITSISSALSAGLTVVTNMHTHRPHYICNNRLYLMLCMQCSLIMCKCVTLHAWA